MSNPQMEQGVIDSFCRALKRHAVANKALVESFSTGGRDRWLAGDYIFTDSTEFCLIEFKDNRAALATEGDKRVSRDLCGWVDKSPAWKDISRQCHHIAWEENGDVVSAPYIDVVCCKKNFSSLTSFPASSDFKDLRDSTKFFQGFQTPPPDVKVLAADFEDYLDVVMSLSSKSSDDLVVVADNVQWEDPGLLSGPPPRLVVSRLHGFGEVRAWIDKRMRSPGNKPAF